MRRILTAGAVVIATGWLLFTLRDPLACAETNPTKGQREAGAASRGYRTACLAIATTDEAVSGLHKLIAGYTDQEGRDHPDHIFELLLVIVGFLQVRVYSQQRRIMASQAGIAKTQAAIAERALTTLEAPAIAIKIIDPGIYIGSLDSNAYERRTLVYRFVNYGRTVAHITGYDQKVRAKRPGYGSPDPFPPEHAKGLDIYGMMVPPNGGETEDIRYSCFNEIPICEGELFSDVRNVPFALFIARYRNVFGAIYVTAFEFMYDAKGTGKFVLTSHGQPYNYLREEETAPHDTHSAS